MKHKFVDDATVDVNVNLDIPTEELGSLVDKVTESAVTIIVVATAAHILRKWLT